MRSRFPLALLGALVWFGGWGSRAQAAFIIDTSPGWTGGGYQPLGEYTFGQTFTVITSVNVLTNFQFLLFQPFDQSPVTVRAYVMAWTGLRADGPILFESAPVTINNVSGNPVITYAPYQFDTGGLALTPGAQYVAFLDASADYSGNSGQAATAANFGNSYADGGFVSIRNSYDFARLSSPTENWDTSSSEDAVFRAEFQTAPAPSSLVLLCLGIASASISRVAVIFVARLARGRLGQQLAFM